MSCGEKDGDVLAYEMKDRSKEFVEAAIRIELRLVGGKVKAIGPRNAVARLIEPLREHWASQADALQSAACRAITQRIGRHNARVHRLPRAGRGLSGAPLQLPELHCCGSAAVTGHVAEPELHCGAPTSGNDTQKNRMGKLGG